MAEYKEPVTNSHPDLLCQNCGQRLGMHSSKYDRCPTKNDFPYYFSNNYKFVATDPPQYRPYGWHPEQVSQELKDLVQKANNEPAPAKKLPKKEKKTKPWEEPKFNTPKEPKGEIKYYKPIPETKDAQVAVAEVDKVTVYKEVNGDYIGLSSYDVLGGLSLSSTTTTSAKIQTLNLTDIKKAVASLGGESVKPYHPQLIHDPDAYRRERGLTQLVQDFNQGFGRGLSPEQFGRGLLEFAKREGYRYEYTDPEVAYLRQQVRQQESYLDQLREQERTNKAELEALKTQMAGMVPKARPRVPRSFEGNGRKFKDIA